MTVLFDFDFNNPADLNNWTVLEGDPNRVIIEDSKLILGDDATNTGNLICIAHNSLIPFNPATIYHWKITCYRNAIPTIDRNNQGNYSSRLQAGFFAYAADGVTRLVYNDNFEVYGHAVGNLSSPLLPSGMEHLVLSENTWHHYTLGTSGSGVKVAIDKFLLGEMTEYEAISSPAILLPAPNGTVYLRPAIIANFVSFSNEQKGRWFINRFSANTVSQVNLTPNQGGASSYAILPQRVSYMQKCTINISNATDGMVYVQVMNLNGGTTIDGGNTQQIAVYIVNGNGEFVIRSGGAENHINGFVILVRQGSFSGPILYQTQPMSYYVEFTQVAMHATKASMLHKYTQYRYITVNVLLLEYHFVETPNSIFIDIDIPSLHYTWQKQVTFTLSNIQYVNFHGVHSTYTDHPFNNHVDYATPLITDNVKSYSVTLEWGKIRIILGLYDFMPGLLDEDKLIRFTLTSNDQNMGFATDPALDIFVHRSASDDMFGMQTYNQEGSLSFDSRSKKMLAYQSGAIVVYNNLVSGTTYVDVPVVGFAPGEGHTVDLNAPVFMNNYSVWHEDFAGFFRLHFYRDTTLAYAPSQISVNYMVFRT